MRDIKGVMRGYCLECGEQECDDYVPKVSGETAACDYCGCPPAKHFRLNENVSPPVMESDSTTMSNMVEAILAVPSVSTPHIRVPSKRSRKGIKVSTSHPTGPKVVKLNTPISLPTYTPGLLSILNSGEGDITSVWDQLIDESAEHFKTFNPGHGSEYKMIGMLIYGTYPRIKMEGKAPWTFFTTCLSRKIRKLRMNTSDKGDEEISQLSYENRKQRSSVAMIAQTNAFAAKNKLLLELSKNNPSKSVILDQIRATFGLRTDLVQSKVELSVLLQSYSCFLQSEYILFEAELLLGDDYQHFLSAVARMIQAVCIIEKEDDVELAFEKVATRLAKPPFPYSFYKDDDSYGMALQSTQISTPTIIVRCSNGEVLNVAITVCNNVVTGMSSLQEALCVFLSLHFCFDIDFAKRSHNLLYMFESFIFGYKSVSISRNSTSYLQKLRSLKLPQ